MQSTEKGVRRLEIGIDDRAERVYFEVILAIYGTPKKNGVYKVFEFKTLSAANKKFNSIGDLIQ
jgi:hypothetical protein